MGTRLYETAAVIANFVLLQKILEKLSHTDKKAERFASEGRLRCVLDVDVWSLHGSNTTYIST